MSAAMTPALGLIALSLLSPSCDAVRRQTAGMVPDLPPAVPVQPFGVRMPPPQLAGQLQPISEQMPASRLPLPSNPPALCLVDAV